MGIDPANSVDYPRDAGLVKLAPAISVKYHRYFYFSTFNYTFGTILNQLGENKQLFKILMGIAWLDGILAPGEKEYLSKVATQKDGLL
jgi:hypothetical protein